MSKEIYTEDFFLQAIEQHQQIIHKVCRLYMHHEQDKKDLFQEILLNAWKGFRHFKGDAKFSTWLYRVALNTSITYYRKDQRAIETVALLDQAGYAPDSIDNEKEQMSAMHQAIAGLSGIDKALVMLYLEDLSYDDIGHIMGITANNVAVKMNRIKTKLKETAKKYL